MAIGVILVAIGMNLALLIIGAKSLASKGDECAFTWMTVSAQYYFYKLLVVTLVLSKIRNELIGTM